MVWGGGQAKFTGIPSSRDSDRPSRSCRPFTTTLASIRRKRGRVSSRCGTLPRLAALATTLTIAGPRHQSQGQRCGCALTSDSCFQVTIEDSPWRGSCFDFKVLLKDVPEGTTAATIIAALAAQDIKVSEENVTQGEKSTDFIVGLASKDDLEGLLEMQRIPIRRVPVQHRVNLLRPSYDSQRA